MKHIVDLCLVNRIWRHSAFILLHAVKVQLTGCKQLIHHFTLFEPGLRFSLIVIPNLFWKRTSSNMWNRFLSTSCPFHHSASSVNLVCYCMICHAEIFFGILAMCCYVLQDQCKAYELQNQFLNQEILELSQLLQQDRTRASRCFLCF